MTYLWCLTHMAWCCWQCSTRQPHSPGSPHMQSGFSDSIEKEIDSILDEVDRDGNGEIDYEARLAGINLN